jgi:selenocysteine lyase/cysteine desulfurase
MPDWNAVRREFPSLEQWTYLNTATYGLMPRAGMSAVNGHFARRDELACTDFLAWFDDLDALRERCAQFIHCEASDIAFVHNAATALSVLTQGIRWRTGDRVVTLEHEFPNNLYAGGALPEGVEFLTVPPEKLFDAINERTRLVAVSMVNYATGYRAPLEELSAVCQVRGAWLYVDGTQTFGALTFDVSRVRPALFAVDAYKWLLSPNGAGFFYIDPAVRAQVRPAVIGWRSDYRWRQVNALHHGLPEFSASAERYEGGMLCTPSLYAMSAVLDLMSELGPAVIEARTLELANRARKQLSEIGAVVNTDSSPIVSARLPHGLEPGAVAAELKQQRIVVSARHGALRVSPHFYNNEEDLDRLVAALTAMSTKRGR